MKMNNKFLIGAMLILVLFLCINASTAAEPLTNDLGTSDVSNYELSVSEDTSGVDTNDNGDAGIISVAASDANGGETIAIENDGHNDSVKSTKSVEVLGEGNELGNVVTNDTFHSYFDDDGILKDSIKFEKLIFNGTFSKVSDYIILNRNIAIAGDNAVLNNIGFVIDSEDVELDGLTLVADGSLGDLIYVAQSNVKLSNLNIKYIVDDEMANAISVNGKNTISNVNITNNEIYFESHVSTDEELTTAINLEDVENVTVDGNKITASLPALTAETYDIGYYMMGLCYVNPVRIYEGASVKFTKNDLDVIVNSFDASYPTIQALYIVGSDDVLIAGNDITMRDNKTPSGTAIYLYAVECGYSSEISFIENDFDILTTGGKSGSGSAYALQIVTSDIEIIGNNISCDSNGPNLGVYSPSQFGPAKDLVITDNFFNVTGLATGTSSYALISAIEVQSGYAKIYNNTIYSMNKDGANDRYPVSAISAVQYSSTITFDIKDNDVYTNGKYAVDIRYKVNGANVTGNFLSANLLKGDEAVYIKSGNDIVIEDNYPTVAVVTNETFFKYFDDNGVLIDNRNYYGLTFEGPFSDLVDTIVINKAFKIYGNNTVLNNIAVKIEADDVELSGLNINADKNFTDNFGAAIYATGSNIKIDDVVVNYTAPSDAEAFGIFAKQADGFALTNSEINFNGTNHDYTDIHQYGLHVADSNDVELIGNKFNATLPARDVNYNLQGIYADLIAGVAVQSGKNVTISRNTFYTNTDGGYGGYPTIDTLLVNGVENLLIDYNNITHIDLASEGSRYYYTVDLYSFTGVVENNNIIVFTTAGVDRAGTAYPIQLTGPFTVNVNNNNLTAVSKGPTHAIYAAAWAGEGILIAENNNIDVTGYATAGGYALVSGIEAEIEVLKAYNNTIVVKNTADYNDTNQVYGISMANDWFTKDVSADIKDNIINVDGKYAVYYKKTVNTNVTYNSLYAHELAGDDSVLIESGNNNTVENNQPPYHFDVIIETNGTWIGNVNPVKVTVVNATGALGTGKVTFKIGGTEFTIDLVDGQANYDISPNLLVAGENEIVVDYISNDTAYRGSSASAKFQVIDGVVTQDNYFVYFNQEDNGRLFDFVPEGATLDFQGSIINPDQDITVQININKPVNVISSTKDAYVDLNTTAGSLLGDSPGNSFAVTRGGSGSNISGIYFHNTQLWISNTTNVVLDNISVVVEDQRVGSGVGATSIRDNSSNVILKNSYLYTRNNGGSTTFTMSWATNCTINNCTIKAEGNVGNLVYLNVYNIVGAPSGVPLNNYNTISNNRIYGKEGSGISVGLMVEGTYNLIVNNTLYKSSISTSFGGQKPANNTYVGNVMTEGGSLSAVANSIVYGNNVTGTLTAGSNSEVYDNIVGKSMTVTAGATAYNNTIATSVSVAAGSIAYNNVVGTSMSVAAGATAYGNDIGTSMTVAKDAIVFNNTIGTTVAINGANAIVSNNNIGGTVTIANAATNTTLLDNDINATVTVNSKNNNIELNNIIVAGEYAIDLKTSTGNNVTENCLIAKLYKGDAAVKYSGENNVKDNTPYVAISVAADDVLAGSNATVIVNVINSMGGNVTIKVNNKEYIVELDENGTATQVIAAEDLVIGANNVTATYLAEGFLPAIDNAVLAVLDGVITNATYGLYFDASGYLASAVPDGATLDFQGLFLGKFPVYINKNVNVISSTGDALFDCGDKYTSNNVNSFNIVAGGDNTNITGLKFINYCLYIKGASNVTVDGVSIVANKRGVGSGTGFLSIHTGAYNTLVKNGYFENGGTGSSLLVLGKGGAYAVFDHNVFNITGSSGNILSANQFVGQGDAPEHVSYTNNVLYNSQPGSAFCYAMTVSGSGNLVENNTIYHNGSGILNQYGASSSGNVYRNNTLYGNTNFNPSANSIVENNKIYATTNIAANTTVVGNTFKNVAISGTNTTFANNDVTGTVTVSGNENTIVENTIASTGDYAVDLKTTSNNTVTDNYLTASLYKGDAAVNNANENNIVENNNPKVIITVTADAVLVGSNGTVIVNVVNGTGNVTIKVNNKEYFIKLDENGTATQVIAAEDLVIGANNVTATYLAEGFLPAIDNAVLAVLDGVITNATYGLYFDASGYLASAVPDGATLDFQGLFLGKFPVYINKNVNVISSTGDALFDCGDKYTSNNVNSFNIVAGGDNTNITGLKFINYCLYIKGASNVTVDGVSIVANKRGVGSGTGFLSIHTGAYNTLVKNGYFENGGTGSSLLVLGKGGAYAVFDHNVFNITGSSGNILSANQFVGQGDAPEHVSYTNNVLYNSQPGSAFCYAMTVSGSGNLVENNTIYHNGSGILNQYGASSSGNVYRNNTLYGNTNFNPSANSIVENNKIYATTNIAANTTVVGNTFKNVAISGTNTTFTNNIVTGTVTVSGNKNTIVDNAIEATSSEYAIDLKSTVNNTVTDNLLYASELAGDAAVKHDNENNTISHNYPFESVLIVEVEDITVGQDAIVNIRFNEPVEGTVEVILNGKKYDVDVIDGNGQINISDLSANKYTVGVFFNGDLKYSPTENSTDFTVEKLDTQVNVTVPSDVEAGAEVAIDIAIPGATGNVSVFVDEVEAVVALDENGTAQFIIPSAEPGEHSVVVVYSGDDSHAVASNTVKFTVDPEFYMDIDADAIYGEDAIVEINLPEDATGNLTVTIGNETYTVPVEDGYASVEIPDLAYGEHNITVAYSGDDKYKAASKESTIDVQPDIEIPDEIDFNDEDEISITLPEDATGNLTVSVDGVETVVPVVNGTASVSLENLTPGDHKISVLYSGDDKYDSASAEKSLSVVPAIEIPEKITTDDDDSISIDLPADATGNLTVSVDGVETVVPVVNGTASVPLGELSAGDHNISVSYSGDGKYSAYSKSVTASVAKAKPTINVTVPSDAQEGKVVSITITLPDDATGTVFVDIGGNGYYTHVNGTTVLNISGLTGGDKNITYRYTGDNKYGEASGNLSAFILFKPKLTNSKNFAMYYFDGSKFTVRAWGIDGKVAAGEIVTITLNKKTYKVKTNKNGVASLKIPNTVKPTKKYTITAQYKTAKVSKKITVKQILKASNKSVKKSAKKLVLSATLKKVKGKYLKGKVIKFKFNGKTYKAKTNKKGVAKVTIKKNVINKLKVGKKYTVKISYYKDTISKKVTVKR